MKSRAGLFISNNSITFIKLIIGGSYVKLPNGKQASLPAVLVLAGYPSPGRRLVTDLAAVSRAVRTDFLLAEAWRSVENRSVGAALLVESSLTDFIALWSRF